MMLHFKDTGKMKHYTVTVAFQGHLRSKVMVPNERCSYL